MEVTTGTSAEAEALLAEARELVTSATKEAHLRLRAILRKLSPTRKRVPAVGNPVSKRSFPDATRADLLAAIELEITEVLKRIQLLTPYKQVERLFRVPASMEVSSQATDAASAAAAAAVAVAAAAEEGGVHTVADAVACGGIDFGPDAEWCRDAAAAAAAGIVLVAPALSPLEAVAATAPGGIYALQAAPGFYVLPGALNAQQQAYWCRRGLRAWVEPPQRRNIDLSADPDASNVQWAEKHGHGNPYSSTSSSSSSGTTNEGAHGVGAPVFASGLWHDYLQWYGRHGANTSMQSTAETEAEAEAEAVSREPLLHGVTWATVGCQYDWTLRCYHMPGDPDYSVHAKAYDSSGSSSDAGSCSSGGTAAEAASTGGGAGGLEVDAHFVRGRWYAPYPSDVRAWGATVAAAVHAAATAAGLGSSCSDSGSGGGSGSSGSTSVSDWGLPMSCHAQSGIFNVYRCRSKLPMGGHVDDMERTHAHPVVSMSLGCTAIFLLGGATKDVRPTPIVLRSGDVMILSGGCRLAFHGVARVFADTCPATLFGAPADAASAAALGSNPAYGDPSGLPGDAAEEEAFAHFLRDTRLNLNVRQVM